MKLSFKKGQKGFTLVELMVVVAILAVLMAVVAPAITGTKETSMEGQTKSDAKACQTAVDNYTNKSIALTFPDVAPGTTGHINTDIWTEGNSGANVKLLDKNGTGSITLATKVLPSGKVAGQEVYLHQFLNFTATTKVYDVGGAVKGASFVPDFLMKMPTSLVLKGDESSDLGAVANTYEEYLWLALVNAPGTSQESRTVEIYRMTKFTAGAEEADPSSFEYTQIF